jgi:hypothetical protein
MIAIFRKFHNLSKIDLSVFEFPCVQNDGKISGAWKWIGWNQMYISDWCSKHQTKAMGTLRISSERVSVVSEKPSYLLLSTDWWCRAIDGVPFLALGPVTSLAASAVCNPAAPSPEGWDSSSCALWDRMPLLAATSALTHAWCQLQHIKVPISCSLQVLKVIFGGMRQTPHDNNPF